MALCTPQMLLSALFFFLLPFSALIRVESGAVEVVGVSVGGGEEERGGGYLRMWAQPKYLS